MRIARALLICLLVAAGCQKPQGTVLGKTPQGELRTILSVKAGNTPPQVTVRGVMIEKCPGAGCWFRLRDGTGVIKVPVLLRQWPSSPVFLLLATAIGRH